MKRQDHDTEHDQLRLARVREAFEGWRRGRTGRDRIPEDLWQAAVDLTDSLSVCKIAGELKLDYNALRRRVQQSAAVATPPRFLEVPMDQFLPSHQCTVHLRSPGGFELTVRVGSGSELQLPLLIERFLSQSR